MTELDPDLDALLRALDDAARENRQSDFDRLERALLERFPGGFSAMPAEVHARYLEVDRAWPTQPASSGEEPAALAGLGPRTAVNARIPAELLDWLREQAVATGRSRSDVLAMCVALVRGDAGLLARLRDRLGERD